MDVYIYCWTPLLQIVHTIIAPGARRFFTFFRSAFAKCMLVLFITTTYPTDDFGDYPLLTS
jgi:hypothetical protein